MGGEGPLEAKEATVLDNIEGKINSVYHFRDHYFETHDLSDAVHKGKRLKEKAQVSILFSSGHYFLLCS